MTAPTQRRAPASAQAPRALRRPPEAPQGLPPQRRLSRSGDFTRVERQGQRAQGRFLVIVARPGRGRVGFTVSRKVGNAVVRNAVKRRLRDVARRHKDRWLHRDLVVIARPDAAGREHAELEADWLAAMGKLDEFTRSAGRPGGGSAGGRHPPPERHARRDGPLRPGDGAHAPLRPDSSALPRRAPNATKE